MLATPGHTAEHLAYVLIDAQRPLAVFTGGSLIVGAAARTDLVGAEHAEALARAQYRSLHRLVRELADDTLVLPTHGAGSFCSAPPGAARTTTIGVEKITNPLLAAPDEDTFVRLLFDGLGSYPAYFARLGEINRRGPELVGRPPTLRPLAVSKVIAHLDRGAQLVDVRPVRDFAAVHIPGALSIALRDAFATWLGWLVDPSRPLVIVRNDDQDADEIVWQALKIGYDRLAGQLAGGIRAWQQNGGATRTLAVIGAADADPARVLDVRQGSEYASGHLPGTHNIELGSLNANPGALARGPVQTMCGHGERAATAASLLAAGGCADVAVVTGGPEDWATTNGIRLRTET